MKGSGSQVENNQRHSREGGRMGDPSHESDERRLRQRCLNC